MLRHLEIKQDQQRVRGGVQQVQYLVPVLGFEHEIAFCFEDSAHPIPNGWIVICHEHGRHDLPLLAP